MQNDFLPTGYEAPVNEGNYFKFKKGKNHFRVMGSAVIGFEYWNKDNKPVRSKAEWDEVPQDARLDDKGNFSPKFFWAFPVYNYNAKKVQIMEITQITVRESLESLISDDAWGNPKGYDIVITATGDGLERVYNVIPKPPTPAPNVKIPYINLQSLFTGADPFSKDIELESVEDMSFDETETIN